MFIPMGDQVGVTSVQHPAVDQEPASSATLLALYSENGEIARTMVEWRHKLILLYVVTIGGLATSAIWLREHNMQGTLHWELAVASLVMFLFVLMEHRTTLILHACYRVGCKFEESLVKTGPQSIYFELHTSQANLITYSNLLRLTYLITAVALAVSAWCLSS